MKRFWIVLCSLILFGANIHCVSFGRHSSMNDESNVVFRTGAKTPDAKVFPEVLRRIREDHLQGSGDESRLFYGAVKGMVQALDDPFSRYFDPEETKIQDDEMNGTFVGIGIGFDVKDGRLVIVNVLKGGSAERAGLKVGDEVVAIDGAMVGGFRLNAVSRRLRGAAGTPISLRIVRDGVPGSREFVVTREEIKSDSVTWAFRTENGRRLAVIAITRFRKDTVRRFHEAVRACADEKADGIILDLRDNPGGLLFGSVILAGAWVGKEPVVSLVRKGGSRKAIVSASEPVLGAMPTVVLVNGGSASASEVLAGALQDYGAARLVGERTYGKGVGQDTFRFDDGSSLRLVTFAWYTPMGHSIHGDGIMPDETVRITSADRAQGKDPQMDRAIAILTSK